MQTTDTSNKSFKEKLADWPKSKTTPVKAPEPEHSEAIEDIRETRKRLDQNLLDTAMKTIRCGLLDNPGWHCDPLVKGETPNCHNIGYINCFVHQKYDRHCRDEKEKKKQKKK